MIPDERDTIVAIASPRGGAARGIVRLSGPKTAAVVGGVIQGKLTAERPTRLPDQQIAIRLAGRSIATPGDVYFWPTAQSYTRQPSAELHTVGSPPVLAAVVEAACNAGARLAEPGEFTLRAVMAGRIDLVQAEAVLSVIDATGDDDLRAALGRLAGGLSGPLNRLRDDLVALLADLEAGLDFVDEEDVRFVEPAELDRRLAAAAATVDALIEQTTVRGRRDTLPRAALCGPPNAGKSSLFNALRTRFAADRQAAQRPALVSPQAGTTRDSLAAVLDADSFCFELIDTAGRDGESASALPARVADRHAERDTAAADLRLECRPAEALSTELATLPPASDELKIATKRDLARGETPDGWLATSATTGAGLDALMTAIRGKLGDASGGVSEAAAAAAERSRQSLIAARDDLGRARAIAADGAEELVALELRSALDALGRVVGAVVTDDLLDRIFSRFCIGK